MHQTLETGTSNQVLYIFVSPRVPKGIYGYMAIGLHVIYMFQIAFAYEFPLFGRRSPPFLSLVYTIQ
jgi:hypothetical protein